MGLYPGFAGCPDAASYHLCASQALGKMLLPGCLDRQGEKVQETAAFFLAMLESHLPAMLLTKGGFVSSPLFSTLDSRSGCGIWKNVCCLVSRILQISEHSPDFRQDSKMRLLCHEYLLKDVIWQKGKYGRNTKNLVQKWSPGSRSQQVRGEWHMEQGTRVFKVDMRHTSWIWPVRTSSWLYKYKQLPRIFTALSWVLKMGQVFLWQCWTKRCCCPQSEDRQMV